MRALLLASLLFASSAHAFCGFYVSSAGASGKKLTLAFESYLRSDVAELGLKAKPEAKKTPPPPPLKTK